MARRDRAIETEDRSVLAGEGEGKGELLAVGSELRSGDCCTAL